MDKKVKFSEQPTRVKIIYAAVIAVLCITAIIVGIVSVANRKDELPEENPPVNEGGQGEAPDGSGGTGDGSGDGQTPDTEGETKLTFISPVVGTVSKYHSNDVPVFSETLDEWRIHKGVDITADEGTEVFAASAGTVSRVYSDPLLGKSVEITHTSGVVSVYSNLEADTIAVKEGDRVGSGTKIGTVGDTSLTELADEAHLHFEIKVDGVNVNPLDYITKDSLENSLGILEV